MRKALIPVLASLALCGAAATAFVISSANAQPGSDARKPLMMAQQNGPGQQRGMMRGGAPGDMAARMQQMCKDGVARQTAQLAFLETKLELTSAQQASFQRWKNVKLDIAKRRAGQCAQRPATQNLDQRPSPAERMARQEDRLKQRLTDIQAERPALDAFYNSLSQAQKSTLDQTGRGGRGGMMHRAAFMHRGGQQGPMQGPGGHGMPSGPDGPPRP